MFKITEKVAAIIYQAIPISLLVTAMVLMLYHEGNIKKNLKETWTELRKNKIFRRQAFCIFYIVMLCMQTVLARKFWEDPLQAVMEGWKVYNNGNWNVEILGNILMFIPYTFLLFWAYSICILKNKRVLYILKKSLYISFLSSLTIEVIQLIFHLGTFQLSDLTYNTLGGIFGGILYWIFYKISEKK